MCVCVCVYDAQVAVIALLKELGVLPDLRVLIEAESMLNDGSAIVRARSRTPTHPHPHTHTRVSSSRPSPCSTTAALSCAHAATHTHTHTHTLA